MKHEGLLTFCIFKQFVIEILFFPISEHFGLSLRKVSPHREIRLRQVQRIRIVLCHIKLL